VTSSSLGRTPLHFAADQGANRQKAYVKRGFVYASMAKGRITIARKMIEVGADKNAIDKFGNRPVDLAVDRGLLFYTCKPRFYYLSRVAKVIGCRLSRGFIGRKSRKYFPATCKAVQRGLASISRNE